MYIIHTKLRMNHPIPSKFLERMQKTIAGSDFQRFADSFSEPPVTSVRINPRKSGPGFGVAAPVPWCKYGRYLEEKPVFTLDPAFHGGAYYPQEASSMILWNIMEEIEGESGKDLRILDLCGAPGGKSTLIASFFNGEGLLVSNEVIRQRAWILRENIIKWGAPNVVVSQSNPSAFSKLSGFFDVMIVDAPCSGEGMFRKGDVARREWSVENTELCAIRQRRILKDSWNALKENGWLIYSTCTFNPAENEGNIRWLLEEADAEVKILEVPPEWGITKVPIESGNGLAFLPHKVKGEGFFVALIQKKENSGNIKLPKVPKNKSSVPTEIKSLLKEPDTFAFLEDKQNWTAFPKQEAVDLLFLQKTLNLLHYGIPLGKRGRKEVIPHHSLAMSWACNEGYPELNLGKEEALRYLKGETPSVSGNIPGGFYRVICNNTPIGFVKSVGNRFNNLYPREWRIRMNV
jgi:16S rRNA C967 or C1407 C5-methylase (RsmB/RsmF family)/NOL1/NOP2/fmu family ribosome biogenesis protein